MVFACIVLAVVIVSLLALFYYALSTGAPPMPSSFGAARQIASLVPHREECTVYEVGAAWGHLAFPLALTHPKCTVRAIEISPLPWLFMKVIEKLLFVRNMRIERRDMFDVSFRDAGAIVCYLHTELLNQLKPKLQDELRSGTLVVSNTYEIPGWTPLEVHFRDDSYCPQIYVYRVP